MGYYFDWNNQENFKIAERNGFIPYETKIEGGNLSYEKIDNHQHGIHDYFKYLKYGFSRSTDQSSWMIRQNIISREEGIKLVKENDGKYPSSYLGKKLDDILKDIDMTIIEFDEVCERFTNKEIFMCDQSGELIKDDTKKLKLINDGF